MSELFSDVAAEFLDDAARSPGEAVPSAVLLVDRDPAVLETLEEGLTRCGFDVFATGDGGAALRAMDEAALGCMLCDTDLPDIQGIDVLRALRKKQPYCAGIIVTGSASSESVVDALRAGATDYLHKPLPRVQLVAERLERAIEGQRVAFERDRLYAQVQRVGSALSGKDDEIRRQRTEIMLFNEILELRVKEISKAADTELAELTAKANKAEHHSALVEHLREVRDFLGSLEHREDAPREQLAAALKRASRRLTFVLDKHGGG